MTLTTPPAAVLHVGDEAIFQTTTYHEYPVRITDVKIVKHFDMDVVQVHYSMTDERDRALRPSLADGTALAGMIFPASHIVDGASGRVTFSNYTIDVPGYGPTAFDRFRGTVVNFVREGGA